jgi:hypothetical protein
MAPRHQSNLRPHSRSSALAAILVAGGLILSGSGCGDKAPASAAADDIDACTLLTGADVDAVLGSAVGHPLARRHGDETFWLSTCHYQADTGNGILSAGLTLKPHHVADGPLKAYTDYETALIAELGDGAALTPVAGIGERAGWQDFGTSVGQLTVFQGPYQLILSASATAGADQLANAKALAGRVLQRLNPR